LKDQCLHLQGQAVQVTFLGLLYDVGVGNIMLLNVRNYLLVNGVLIFHKTFIVMISLKTGIGLKHPVFEVEEE
jgi:hypothetical protein